MGGHIAASFQEACEKVAKAKTRLAHVDNTALGYLYGHYKQATAGDCSMSEPRVWDVKNRAKFCEWNKLRGMNSKAAMKCYIKVANSLLEA